MVQTSTNIRMDDNLRQQLDWLCNELDLSMTTAINIFTKTTARRQGISSEASLGTPSPETLVTIGDINYGRNLSKTFHSVAELMEDLNA